LNRINWDASCSLAGRVTFIIPVLIPASAVNWTLGRQKLQMETKGQRSRPF